MILALDPSSTCIGWALFAGDRLSEYGVIKPSPSKLPTNLRIDNLWARLQTLLNGHTLQHGDQIVMEDCSAQAGRGARAGKGAGLPVYGKAVGYFWARLDAKFDPTSHGPSLHLVEVQEWTQRRINGRKVAQRKEQRQAWVAYNHGSYRTIQASGQDPGGDMADAIALGEWWITEQAVKAKTGELVLAKK
jgi:hypothetical protein